MSDADVAVPPAVVPETSELGDTPVAPPPTVTINGVVEDAPAADSTTQAASNNVGGLDAGASRSEVIDTSDKRLDDLSSNIKLGRLEVSYFSVVATHVT